MAKNKPWTIVIVLTLRVELKLLDKPSVLVMFTDKSLFVSNRTPLFRRHSIPEYGPIPFHKTKNMISNAI